MKTSEIVEILGSLLRADHLSSLVCLIWYGSRQSDADIDLFLISSKETNWRHCSFGRLDLTCMPLEEFQSRMRRLDPVAVEPILTGDCVAGRAKTVQELKSELLREPLPRLAVPYLLRRSLEEYLTSSSLVDLHSTNRGQTCLLWSLINLGYAFSYRLLSHIYSTRKWAGPVTLGELRRMGLSSAFEQLCQYVHWAKRNPRGIDKDDIVRFQREWEGLTLAGRKKLKGASR